MMAGICHLMPLPRFSPNMHKEKNTVLTPTFAQIKKRKFSNIARRTIIEGFLKQKKQKHCFLMKMPN